MKRVWIAVAIVVAAVVPVGAVETWRYFSEKVSSVVPKWELCTAEAALDGQTYQASLGVEEAENAAIITGVALMRGMPARAATIALATAIQESKLRNLDYGDSDSVGLFQQRPSQGWGTEEQIADPFYAAEKFYEALDKVADYTSIPLTEAAQAVQRSAYPDAYAKHENRARALASTLSGFTPHGFSCAIEVPGAGSALPDQLISDYARLFAVQPQAVAAADGHREISIDVDDPVTGWALAHYAVAMAKKDGITAVYYAEYRWEAGLEAEWKPREGDYNPVTLRIVFAPEAADGSAG